MFISLKDITIRAGNHLSFAHTSWQLEPDQHWAILGPNGSGKSTLAKAVSQTVRLEHGQIRYYFDPTEPGGRGYLNPGEILTFSAETHQTFLRRFAEYHQARWQSFEGEEAPVVRQILTANSSAAPAAVEQSIHLFGLEPLLDRKVHLLSHGESRKVFLARLLSRSPRLLILDDPFTGLDAASRERLSEGIEGLLQAQSPAILYAGARVDDLPAGISHVLLVQSHRVIASGEREAALAQAGELEKTAEQPYTHQDTDALRDMIESYAAQLAKPVVNEPPALIEMKNITVSYQETPVLQQVNWTVRQGERWALLGPNGAGKTTLLSLILADNPQAYRNEICLFGKKRGSGESIWEIKARIGWVSPELHAFYPRDATCQEVICSGFYDSVGLFRRCTADQRSTAAGWAEALGIGDLLSEPFYSLSAGEQRLALLSRALVKFPALLVLDEPCQGLDAAHRTRFVRLVEAICARAPVTLIYVSHYPEELPGSITHRLNLS